MTTFSFGWIFLANICLNLVVMGLLYRWRVSRRQADYHALCRQTRQLCQQVGKTEAMWGKLHVMRDEQHGTK